MTTKWYMFFFQEKLQEIQTINYYKIKLEQQKISGISFIGSGRLAMYSTKIEKQLATCIKMCSVGFSPTINQEKKLNQEYVKDYNISTPFTDNMPGKTWF